MPMLRIPLQSKAGTMRTVQRIKINTYPPLFARRPVRNGRFAGFLAGYAACLWCCQLLPDSAKIGLYTIFPIILNSPCIHQLSAIAQITLPHSAAALSISPYITIQSHRRTLLYYFLYKTDDQSLQSYLLFLYQKASSLLHRYSSEIYDYNPQPVAATYSGSCYLRYSDNDIHPSCP